MQAMVDLTREGGSATKKLIGRSVRVVRRHRENELLIEFEDGTRLFVDSESGLELSITGVFDEQPRAAAVKQTAHTVSNVESIEVEVLSGQGNYAVIRLPERKYPGVVMQGDSLSTLVADLRQCRDQFQRGEADDGMGWLDAVLEQLESVQRSYEAALAARSIPLPY